MNRAPAYQMFAGDWNGSRSIRLMEDYQHGWYINLLNEAWAGNPQCMLPKDDATLQILARVSASSRALTDFNDRWTFVRSMFKDHGDYLANDRQLEELANQTLRRKQAEKAGVKSAVARKKMREALQDAIKQHVAESNGRSTDAQRNVNGRATDGQRNGNTSSSSSDSGLQASLDEAALHGLQLARLLSASISSWKPDFAEIQPSHITRTTNRWAADIAKAISLDHRAPEKIERVIRWLPSHEGSGGFRWRAQILSGKKLRQQFDRLEMAMDTNGGNGSKPVRQRAPDLKEMYSDPNYKDD